jgi:hypothetical protein
MNNLIITTFDGSTANKRDCRFIKGEFYIKNKQCFLIEGIWYRINSGFITYDNETCTWALSKTTKLEKGIVGYDNEKAEVILGFYSPNSFRNIKVVLPNGQNYGCIDYKVLPPVFRESTRDQVFYHESLSTHFKDGIPQVNFGGVNYGFALPYCVKDYEDKTYQKIKSETENNFKSKRPKTNIGSYMSEIMNDMNYTFGFEFESSKGKVPAFRLGECGLLPLRDGSIAGVEYATIPVSGSKGVAIIEAACENLKKYTEFSRNESLHLHIGNFNVDKKTIAYLYTICCILEDEVYSLFPKYYAQTSKFKAKEKDYNMPLKKELICEKWEETFGNVSFFLAAGRKFTGLGMAHPSDERGEHKWMIDQRYFWCNVIPLMFGTTKTIEFRCHVPTNDPVKVINWLYICSAIVKYAESLAKINADLSKQKGINLNKVIDFAYGKRLAEYLRDYVGLRKQYRRDDDDEGDYTGEREIKAELSKSSKRLYKDIN